MTVAQRTRPNDNRLLNRDGVEWWPAWLGQARRSADARLLARADWLIRERGSGRYLAAVMANGQRLGLSGNGRGPAVVAALPAAVSLPADYAEVSGLNEFDEPDELMLAGFDRFKRPLFLIEAAALAWQSLRDAAATDGIALDAISGYRSHAYQHGIFARKLARGQTLEAILKVNAAPGFSEHATGRAIDIGTHGEPPAEASFEATPAYRWLMAHADRFGFVLSYPRGNPHGIDFEPWHWAWHPPRRAAQSSADEPSGNLQA